MNLERNFPHCILKICKKENSPEKPVGNKSQPYFRYEVRNMDKTVYDFIEIDGDSSVEKEVVDKPPPCEKDSRLLYQHD